MNSNQLGEKSVHRLLWELSIPAMLGMLSSAIFNVADRYFVGRIDPLALSGVGITMPIQIMQMAIVLLIGIGSSTLVSIRLGENRRQEAEEILFVAFKYIILLMAAFAAVFMLFKDQVLDLLHVSEAVYPYAEPYIVIMIVGGIVGIPGYCLNNSIRAIGKTKVSMLAILYSSLLNIVLDPLLIFVFDLGVAGAAIATVISQTAFTVFITGYFLYKRDLDIHLKLRRVPEEGRILKQIFINGSPSFYVQVLASFMNIYINSSFVRYGSDLDVAAITIIATIFSFYHMVVFGIVQGNQPIVGYNMGSRRYDRVAKAIEWSLLYSFVLSVLLFAVIQLYPQLLVGFFATDPELIAIASGGIRIYLLMLPLIGPQTIAAQYFQSASKPKLSSFLLLLRYGVIVVPLIILLAPRLGVFGIYLSNAVSDLVASAVAIFFITIELKQLGALRTQEKISGEGV